MELLLIIGIVAALYFGYQQGSKDGEEKASSSQRQKVISGMAPNSAFHRVYGVPGFYLADACPGLDGMPLVSISSADFLEFIAGQKVSDDASREEIEKVKSQFSDSYLLATGMSPDTLETLKRVFPIEKTGND